MTSSPLAAPGRARAAGITAVKRRSFSTWGERSTRWPRGLSKNFRTRRKSTTAPCSGVSKAWATRRSRSFSRSRRAAAKSANCIKAWRAVPRSAGVMPCSPSQAGRERVMSRLPSCSAASLEAATLAGMPTASWWG